jgi:hypothetical protein
VATCRDLLLQLADQVLGLFNLPGHGRDVGLVLGHAGAEIGRIAPEQCRGLVEHGAQLADLLVDVAIAHFQVSSRWRSWPMSALIFSPWPVVTQPARARPSSAHTA